MSGSVGLVCLDKDGTLIVNEPYNVEPARITPAPGAEEALDLLAREGYRLVVITNQPGVALGYFPAAALDGVRQWLDDFFADAGAVLSGFYVCPHAGGCGCRKPAPALVERALDEQGATPAASWLVGDILDDVEAGSRAGCRTVLIGNGNETEWRAGPYRTPTVTVPDLAAAAKAVVGGAP